MENLDEETYNIIDKLQLEKIQHGFGELRQIIIALHRIGENAVTLATTAINAIAIEKERLDHGKIPVLKYRF